MNAVDAASAARPTAKHGFRDRFTVHQRDRRPSPLANPSLSASAEDNQTDLPLTFTAQSRFRFTAGRGLLAGCEASRIETMTLSRICSSVRSARKSTNALILEVSG